VSPEDANAKIRNEFAAVLRGWSPTAAETAALQFLMNSMQLIWAGVGKQ
jgi:hypothetical protein